MALLRIIIINWFCESFISKNPVVDFGGDMQTMNNVLVQRDGCVAVAVTSHVAAGIAKKWWRQHVSDFDGGAT